MEKTMQKLDAANPLAMSTDFTADNVARLKALFPELVTEGPEGVSVNVDVLKTLIGDRTVSDADERYGFHWHGKRDARQAALTPSTGTLRPCPDDSVAWDDTRHLMIEGDNLDVMKLLHKSYAGKVKLVYIDPPYNTGNDFVYADDFSDSIRHYLAMTGQTEGGVKRSTNTEANGRFHTDWLNMMYPRLKLAHALLSEEGLIVVHIDEHEVHALVLMLREIFGEENELGVAVWDKRNPKGDARGIAYQHESLVLFARNAETLLERAPLKRPKRNAQRMYENVPSVLPFGGSDDALLKALGIPFEQPKPVDFAAAVIGWCTRGDDIVLDCFAGSGSTGHAVMQVNATDGGARRYILVQLPEPLDRRDKTQQAAADFCAKLKKPATLAEVTKERLRRAAQQVARDYPESYGDLGFRVYRLDTTNVIEWDPRRDDFDHALFASVEHVKTGRTDDDLLAELTLKLGLDLCTPVEHHTIAGKTVHLIGREIVACFDARVSRDDAEPLADGIVALLDASGATRDVTCLFRDSGFVDDVAKLNLAALLEQHGVKRVRSL
ncbi:site-specific DNA-methyltransferase [Burkholderia multivorans]|nr:site-specific DNA-methyltransferase [Burkholderia multivorans]